MIKFMFPKIIRSCNMECGLKKGGLRSRKTLHSCLVLGDGGVQWIQLSLDLLIADYHSSWIDLHTLHNSYVDVLTLCASKCKCT